MGSALVNAIDYLLSTQALIAFLGGAVTWGMISSLFRWWVRPIIRVELLPSSGCYVTTHRDTNAVKFLRLRIKNRGWSSVRGCEGFITSIRKSQGGQVEDTQEVLELKWSNRGALPRTIPRGAFFYMDIVALDLLPEGNTLQPSIAVYPHNLHPLFASGGKFEVGVLVAADNARQRLRTIIFYYDSTDNDLHFESIKR